jgi:hypothetical protein
MNYQQIQYWAGEVVKTYAAEGDSEGFRYVLGALERVLSNTALEPAAPPTLGINVQEEIQTDEKIGGG